jgi:hypothetical protein
MYFRMLAHLAMYKNSINEVYMYLPTNVHTAWHSHAHLLYRGIGND